MKRTTIQHLVLKVAILGAVAERYTNEGDKIKRYPTYLKWIAKAATNEIKRLLTTKINEE